MSNVGLATWAIYESPRDYPGLYVLRVQWALPGRVVPEPEPRAVGPTLESVRKALPPGLVNLGRQEGDDWPIVEVWI